MHSKGSREKRPMKIGVLVVFSLLSCIVAFILSLLCIFAGSKSVNLEKANLLTLNTSRLGHSILEAPKSVDPDSKLGHIVGAIEGEVNDLIADIADELHIHDFYSVHLQNYCEGFYTPSPVANQTVHPTKNITACSKRTSSFHFNATNVIQQELKSDISLPDLAWPSALQDGLGVAKVVTKVMFVLYCVGVATTGLAICGIVAGIIGGRLMAILDVMLTTIAFLSLLLASTISTTFIDKAVKLVNDVGDKAGIAAYKGNTFLGMTWAATILLFIASVTLIEEYLRRRRARKMSMGTGFIG